MRFPAAALPSLTWHAALVLLLACADDPAGHASPDAGVAPVTTPGAARPGDAGDAEHDGAADAGLEPDPPPTPQGLVGDPSDCAERTRAAGRAYPQTVAEAVELINALPKPTSLPCFLASLPRPLSLVATDNITSAQPADGRESPRIFLLDAGLTLSVVPSGEGRALLELGEYVEIDRSLKAEIEFPVEQALDPQSPFSRVFYNEGRTTCGFCHRDERPHERIAGAFVSLAFRTFPELEVPIDEVREESVRCDEDQDADRCRMLEALFGFGDVLQGAFPAELPTFL